MTMRYFRGRTRLVSVSGSRSTEPTVSSLLAVRQISDSTVEW
jgi:hypothetical protein